MKKITLALFFICTLSLRLLAASSSSLYELSNSEFSSGGIVATAGTTTLFQSVGPLFTGQSQGYQVSTPSTRVIHGLHISSEISSIGGFQPYSRLTLPLAGNQNGIIVTQMEFKAVVDGVTMNLGVDTNPLDGWGYSWNTLSPVPRGALVRIYARAFDGLSWGTWFQTQSFYVDNEAPKITTVNLTTLGQALNSGYGQLNYQWNASDNLPATLSITVQIDKNSINPKLFPGLRLWLDASDETSVVYADNAVSRWRDKSGYGYDAVQDDSRGKPRVQIWAKGLLSVRFSGDGQFLRTAPYTSENRVSGSVFIVFKPQFQMRSVNPALIGVVPTGNQTWKLALGGDSQSILTQRGGLTPQSYPSAFTMDRPYVASIVWKNEQEWLYINKIGIGGPQSIDTNPLRQWSGATLIGAFNGTDDFFTGDIAEVLMFNRCLSDSERGQIESYLTFKWTTANATWVTQNASSEAASLSFANQPDNTWYKSRLTIHDKAGNEIVTSSIMVRTPNRTPPVIGIVDAGQVLLNLSVISGTEDVSSSLNITAYKWSASDFGDYLSWRVKTYTALEDIYKASVPLLKSAYVPSVQSKDFLTYVVSPNANTGDYVGAAIVTGNRYGKEAGFIALTLIDRQGNTVTQDIRIHLKAINDSPFFKNNVTDGSLYKNPDTNEIIYNIRINEYTQSAAIRLDDFIDDLDDLLSSLTITVSGNALYQVGTIPFNSAFHSKFQSQNLAITIGNAASGHAIVISPSQYWYGNTPVTINISDNKGLLSKSAQSFKIRIWPVNQPPLISSNLPTIATTTENSSIVLNLSTFKNDNPLEDALPTYNTQLTWSVATYNTTFISRISGQYSTSDIITITPTQNRYGTSNITLRLTDTDNVPRLTFPYADPVPYTPNPLSRTVNMTLVWLPVNSAPTIATVSQQVKNEDSGPWDLDLTISDAEDSYSDLTVTVNASTTAFFTYSFDKPSKRITFTPRANAFGTANITVQATDKDTGVTFVPYTPNPKTFSKSFIVKINAVNDTPSISAITTQTTTPYTSRLMVSDRLTVAASGFSDVGYSSGQARAVTGSEYIQNDVPTLNFYKNTPLYNYVYTYITNNRTVTVSSTLASAATSNIFTLSSLVEGATVNALVYPNDGYKAGTPLTRSFKVNNRPSLVSPALPLFDAWINTSNVTLSWGASTDAEGDPIYHRLKIWLVSSWFAPAPTTNIEGTSDYDSGWQTSDFSNFRTTLPDGTYYWAVYSGNKFSPTQYDYRDPESRLSKFHIDTTAIQIVTRNSIVYVKELNASTNVIGDAGSTRVLYGAKPAGDNFNEGYKVYLQAVNTNAGITTTSLIKIAELAEGTDWSYTITYPRGTTAYDIFVVDQANNTSNYQSFTIVEDVTPPTTPTLSTRGLVLNTSAGLYEAISSANYFQVTGNKEVGASIWYSGVQLVGFTDTAVFSAFIYPEKATGRIYSTDRVNNQSGAVTINITFIQGAPTLTLSNQSRTVVNSSTNPLIQSLSTSVRNSISQTVLSWRPSRTLSRYQWVNASGVVLASGSTATLNTTIQTTINGSDTVLSEGANTLTLKGWDTANNLGTLSTTLTLRTKAPTTNLITHGEATFSNNKWRVDINGTQLSNATVQILVDGIAQYVATYNNNTWKYVNTNFDLANKDIILKVTDDVYNEATRTIWDHRNLSNQTSVSIASLSGDSEVGIVQPYLSLPANTIGLFSKPLNPKSYISRTGLSVSSQQTAFNFKFDDPSLTIPATLQKSMYHIYGKAFDNTLTSALNLKGFDIKVAIPYEAGTVNNASLTAVYFDETKGVWVRPDVNQLNDNQNSRMLVTIDKTGVWGLAQSVGSIQSLDDLVVYPNPWVPNDSDVSNGTLISGITFGSITTGSTIRIYTISGQLVKEMTPGITSWVWDGRNSYGKDVASGVYIYLITDGPMKKTGKLTVIR